MSGDKRVGRPDSITPPPGAVVSDKVERPPEARMDNRIENAPAQMVDPSKSVRVAEPLAAEAPAEKKHTWHKVYIDLGPSTDHISINGVTFHQGTTPTVRDDLLPVLNEVMFNTKMHEAVVKGQASPIGRRLQSGGRF